MNILKKLNQLSEKKFNDSVGNEVYECKNPVLMRNLKQTDSFETCMAESAEMLGKYLQSTLKKQRDSEKISKRTLSRAIKDTIKYGDPRFTDALFHSPTETLKVLMATWSKGDKIAECLGIKKEDYNTMCKNINENYCGKNQNNTICKNSENSISL